MAETSQTNALNTLMAIQYVQRKLWLEVILQHWKLAWCEANWEPGAAAWSLNDKALEMFKDAERQIWYLNCWTAVEKLNVFWDPRTWAKKQRGDIPHRLLTDAEVTEALGGSTADELATVPTYEAPTIRELGSAVEAPPPPEAKPGETHLAVGGQDVPSVMDRRYIRDKLYKADVKATAPTRTRTRTPSPASSGSSSTYSNIVQEDQVKDSSEDPSRPGKRFKKSGSS